VRAYYCDHFVLPLPDGHRFPMEKYRLLRERVASDGTIELAVPESATSEDLRRVHTDDYVTRVTTGSLTRDEVRRIGFPWSPELVERSRRSAGGTIAAAESALVEGVSVNLAGGTHHAFADRGEGFCVFNDVAMAARRLQAVGSIERCSVIDLDVHQGNGTAALFQHDETVFTASVHGAANYPFRKEASDLDIGLPDGTTDRIFLDAVRTALEAGLETTPDLVFYVAGADPFEHDRLGRLAVTHEGLQTRDTLVLGACARAGVPVAVVMSGGYAQRVEDTVDIHSRTVMTAAAWSRPVAGARTGPLQRHSGGTR